MRDRQREGVGHGGRRRLNTMLDREWTDWLPINAYAIEHPEGVIVVDTGETARAMEPGTSRGGIRTTGCRSGSRSAPPRRSARSSRRSGSSRATSSSVVLTHMHTDTPVASTTSRASRSWRRKRRSTPRHQRVPRAGRGLPEQPLPKLALPHAGRVRLASHTARSRRALGSPERATSRSFPFPATRPGTSASSSTSGDAPRAAPGRRVVHAGPDAPPRRRRGRARRRGREADARPLERTRGRAPDRLPACARPRAAARLADRQAVSVSRSGAGVGSMAGAGSASATS